MLFSIADVNPILTNEATSTGSHAGVVWDTDEGPAYCFGTGFCFAPEQVQCRLKELEGVTVGFLLPRSSPASIDLWAAGVVMMCLFPGMAYHLPFGSPADRSNMDVSSMAESHTKWVSLMVPFMIWYCS